MFFFVKQKTAYEVRISDWSSDVCSSDLKAQGIGRWIGIRVELHHGIVIGEPGRVCVPCIQGGIFQQAQPPMPGGIRLATTAQPVVPIVWMTAQVLPCQRRAIQVQNVEIGRRGIPRFGTAIRNTATSLCWGCAPPAKRRSTTPHSN